MKLSNTHGETTISLSEAFLSTYDCGGSFIIDVVPSVSLESLSKDSSYCDVAAVILAPYLHELNISNHVELITDAYSHFPADVIKMKHLSDGDCHLAELFHGPTKSFKDLSTILLVKIIEAITADSNKQTYSLIVTSGDTGSSAITAALQTNNIRTVLLLPTSVSEFQRLQMVTTDSEKVNILEIDTNCDELDIICQKVFEDDTRKNVQLISLNSLNIGRVICQLTHFFYVYMQVADDNKNEMVEVAIPTGGCGNLVSALIAIRKGLNIKPIICTNQHDFFIRLFETGVVERSKPYETYASAMDTQFPYNFWRVIYCIGRLAAYDDAETRKEVRRLSSDFTRQGFANLNDRYLFELRKRCGIHRCSDADIDIASRRCYEMNDAYICCPHTACAVSYAQNRSTTDRLVCLSPANPVKFGRVVEKVIGKDAVDIDGVELEEMRQKRDCSRVVAIDKIHDEITKILNSSLA